MKRLNKDKIIALIFILIAILIILLIGIKIYLDFFKKESNAMPINRLELYGYSLDTYDTSLYKEKYNQLSDVLNSKEINFDKYAELLGSLYIIDFYTLNNKLSSTDVGSIEFVYPDALDNFKLKAGDTIYKYVEINFDGTRNQDLPEVNTITLKSTEKSMYIYGEDEFDSYKLKYMWTYAKDLGYQTESEVVIIKDENKLYVVESD